MGGWGELPHPIGVFVKQSGFYAVSEIVRALLAESIDYAGMFPPARLSLDDALQNYLRYLQHPDAWLIGRFVCPAGVLDALGTRASSLRDVRPSRRSLDGIDARLRALGSLGTVELVMELESEFDLDLRPSDLERIQSFEQVLTVIQNRIPHRVAVIATACEDSKTFVDSLRRDVANIVEFHKQHGDYAEVDSLELRLPDFTGSLEPAVDLLKSVRRQSEMAELPPLRVMIEVRPYEDPQQLLALLDALESIRDDQLGLKIRTGGLPPDQLPSADQLAFFMDACRVARRRWKATAGLHQPFSHLDSEENIWRFGFVNVLAAAVLTWTKRITHPQISEILIAARDAFVFTDTMLSWKDVELTMEDVQRGRACSMTSFGTCSFEEPSSGLRGTSLIS